MKNMKGEFIMKKVEHERNYYTYFNAYERR